MKKLQLPKDRKPILTKAPKKLDYELVTENSDKNSGIFKGISELDS
jgi:hypothetical protein